MMYAAVTIFFAGMEIMSRKIDAQLAYEADQADMWEVR